MKEKSILIFSAEFDASTDHVIDWLKYFNAKFIRLNAEDDIKCINLRQTENGIYFQLMINNRILIKSSEIKSFWYRRGNLKINKVSDISSLQIQNDVSKKIVTLKVNLFIINLEKIPK